MNPYKDVEDNFNTSQRVSYEDIASKLLKDNYFLTALELHTELVETGRELPQLREFFSNPGNFEQHVSRTSEFGSMNRTPSQATLDSLDTARYSEDGGGDRGGSGGEVAVLEFELRKARETIKALRANLTQFADGDSALDKNAKDRFNKRSLKPHEKRALNYLINEYLLLQDYKLTSITFSDENPDQEFEDWDDVGLNMPRPAGLVSLFWGNAALNVPKMDAYTEIDLAITAVGCQTEAVDVNVCASCQTSFDNHTDWNHELLIQAEEIELLKQKVIALETEKLNFQKLYDAAIVSLNSLTSPTSDTKGLDFCIPDEKLTKTDSQMSHFSEPPITTMATENHYGSGNSGGTSTHSATPEQFEMIDSEKNSTLRKESSNTSSFEPAIPNESAQASPLRRGSVNTLDETSSMNDATEWTRVPYEYSADTGTKEMWIDCCLPNSLKLSILNWCCETLNLNEPLSNDLLAELVNNDKPVTLTGLLTLVVDTLPRIIPHTLVARRCEAAALLAASAALLSPGDARRERTIQALLTLVKRPTTTDTRAICEATCLVVKWGGSGEVLSAIAELLTSKSAERRLLASQICVVIAPYVPIELCTSLLLSLVLLMCESSETDIRSLGLKAACLICPVADQNKYGQLENLMFGFLKDSVDVNVKDTVDVFVPVLARSSLIAGKFSSGLCCRVISNLVQASKENELKTVILYLEVIKVLVQASVAHVINVQIVRDVTLTNCDIETVNLQDIPLEGQCFIDLQCYMTDNIDVKVLVVAMNSLLKDKPDVRWTELSWFIKVVKQLLEVATNSKVINHPTIYEHLLTLFSKYIDSFTVRFASIVLRPIFYDVITDLEHKMEKLHTINVNSTVVVGIYLATLLPAVDSAAQQSEFLQKWIVYSSIRSLPVKMFAVPLKWLAAHKPETLYFCLQHLREFAASICENSSGTAIRVNIATLIGSLVSVAHVTSEAVERHVLPCVVALMHDDDASVRAAAITAWGNVAQTCVTHGYACEALCWAHIEQVLGSDTLSVAEGARWAEAVSLLVCNSSGVCERAVSLLCELCHRQQLTSEWILALAPGLQLAAHHCHHHPGLLPALRKLEETVQAPSLSQYKPTIEALLHNMTGGPVESRPPAREPPRAPGNMQTAHEVGRRVTQMFQQSKNNMNLQNIFKKKT